MVATHTIGFTPGMPVAIDPFLMSTIFAAPQEAYGDAAKLGRLVCGMAMEGMNPVFDRRAPLRAEHLRPIMEIAPHRQRFIRTGGGWSGFGMTGDESYEQRDTGDFINGEILKALEGDSDAKCFLAALAVCRMLGDGGHAALRLARRGGSSLDDAVASTLEKSPAGPDNPGKERLYSLIWKALLGGTETGDRTHFDNVNDWAASGLEILTTLLDPQKHRVPLAHVLGRIGDLKSSPEHHRRAVEVWMPMCREGAFGTMGASSVLAVFQNAAFDVWQTRDRGFIYQHLNDLAESLSKRFSSAEAARGGDRYDVAGIAEVTAANFLVASAVAAFAEGLDIKSMLEIAYITWNNARGIFFLGDMGDQDEGATSASEAISKVMKEYERLYQKVDAR